MQEAAATLVNKINNVILEPIAWILVALSLIMFFYGFAMLSFNSSASEKEGGKKHMIYGVVGLVIIFSVWGIMNLIISTIDNIA